MPEISSRRRFSPPAIAWRGEEDTRRYREEHLSFLWRGSVVQGQINEAERNRLHFQNVVKYCLGPKNWPN